MSWESKIEEWVVYIKSRRPPSAKSHHSDSSCLRNIRRMESWSTSNVPLLLLYDQQENRRVSEKKKQNQPNNKIYKDCRLFLVWKDHLYVKLNIIKDLSIGYCIITNKNNLRDTMRIWHPASLALHKGIPARSNTNTAWCLVIRTLISLHSEWIMRMTEWVEAGKINITFSFHEILHWTSLY